MMLDEGVVIVFLCFALYFHCREDKDQRKGQMVAYALIAIIVLSIIKNLATLLRTTCINYKKRKEQRRREVQLV